MNGEVKKLFRSSDIILNYFLVPITDSILQGLDNGSIQALIVQIFIN